MGIPVNIPPLDVPGLLRQYGLRPDKRLGQNFLIDDASLQRVTAAADISPEDTVLEIGAGLGSLTRHLAPQAQHVFAVEIDARLIPPLNQVLSPYPNVKIIEGDILSLDLEEILPGPGYLVVANIPYNITSALIRHLLEASLPPKRLILTVQREVAERICAAPGEMSLLTLSVQVYGQPRVMARIPAGAFYPTPQVDSAVVRVDVFSDPFIPTPLLDDFFLLAKAGFSQKRKTLRNALSGGLGLPPTETATFLLESGIDPMRRSETLSLEEWRLLVENYRFKNTL